MRVRLVGLVAMSVLALPAADITGTVSVTRKLTRARITPSASAYERGPATEPAASFEDSLEWERRHVVVYLEGDLHARPIIAAMQQKGRNFSPDLLAIPAGSKVSFPNLDLIFHNVFSLSRAKAFDLGNYSNGQTREVEFPVPGVVTVNCRLHPNMAASIVVTPNAWAAIADRTGHFTIAGVPPGSYTVVAWHKSAGTLRQQVRVDQADVPPLEFQMPLAQPVPAVASAGR